MPRHTDSRQRLLEIATDLIWESSYGRASVDRICERAEIRKGSFYHHFESKEQLALEALEHQWQIYRRELNEIFSPLVPPIERLRRHIAEALETQESMRDKVGRSEEHTSELQSQSNLVCRLLLEKKKKKQR